MQIRSSILETAAVIIIFYGALWLWTLPIHNNPMPFGDVDASSHFTIGDYMASTDQSVLKTPYHIKFRYGGQNSAFPEYLWYAPQYWTNTGIGQILGGERIVPFFIMIVIFCSIIVLSSYVLIRSLFGVLPAILSSFLLIFSTRDYMVYLWGQWPQSLSFAFTPLVLYCAYKYHEWYLAQSQGRAAKLTLYACMMGVFIASQFFFHPQGMIASVGALMLFVLFLFIKERKLAFSFKHLLMVIGIAVVTILLFAPFNVGEFVMELLPQPTGDSSPGQGLKLSKLFHWYQGIKNDPGLPDFYFTYNQTHGTLAGGIWSWWTLPLLLLGIVFLLLRRRPQELLLISWLCSYYLLTRLSVIGMGTRDIRMFAYEAHVFYPIIVVGLLAIPSLMSQGTSKVVTKWALVAIFVACAIAINGASAYEVLKSQQLSIGRINPHQYEAAQWIKDNLPYEIDIYDFGTLGFQNYAAKIKWMGVLSQRHFIVDNGQGQTADYVLIDYTDALALNNEGYIGAIAQFEQQFRNASAIYNKNDIRVYQVDGIDV